MVSPTDEQKMELLYSSNALLYTPPNEHFGIVPLEGMYCGLPVIALDSGGPVETVTRDGTAGVLVPNDVHAFSEAMAAMVRAGKRTAQQMGMEGRMKVSTNFSFTSFAEQLDQHVRSEQAKKDN